jgi:hypothetical protein
MKHFSLFETFLLNADVSRDRISKCFGIKLPNGWSKKERAIYDEYVEIMKNPYELVSLRDVDVLSLLTGYSIGTITKMAKIGGKKILDLSENEYRIYVKGKNAPRKRGRHGIQRKYRNKG